MMVKVQKTKFSAGSDTLAASQRRGLQPRRSRRPRLISPYRVVRAEFQWVIAVVLPQALVRILRNSSGLLSLFGERPRGRAPQ
jgi:hypothetical protein